MKTYYLNAIHDIEGVTTVTLSDTKQGTTLLEIEAESFAAATKKLCFKMSYSGKSGHMLVTPRGLIAEVF